jgi:hypothetical protein
VPVFLLYHFFAMPPLLAPTDMEVAIKEGISHVVRHTYRF